MELQYSYIYLISTLVLFIVIIKTIKNLKTSNSSSKSPPGPWKLPLIGNLHQLDNSLPHHALKNLSEKYGPIMSLQLGHVSALIVSSPDVAKQVMKTHDTIFATRPHILSSRIMSYNSTNIAFAPYGEYWRQLRKICTLELLSAKRVQSFRPIRDEEISYLINSIFSEAGSAVNLTKKIYSLTCGITSRAAFGKKSRDQDKFVETAQKSIKLSAGFNIGDLYPNAEWLHLVTGMKFTLEKLHEESDRILDSIIGAHKVVKEMENGGGDDSGEDLVDALLKYHEQGESNFSLTADNIKAVLWDVFAAGSDTSAATMEWAMVEMMKHPRIMKKAQAEIRQLFSEKGKVDEETVRDLKYTKLIVKEVLRLHPPAPLLLPRECGEKCEINGYTIPIKTKVIINAWAIGRDPKYWNDPERFVPERFIDGLVDYKGNNFEYIPFGAGRRICPGITFGLTNVEVPLANFLYYFDWELPEGINGDELDMTEEFGAVVGRKEDLYVIPTPYQRARVQA